MKTLNLLITALAFIIVSCTPQQKDGNSNREENVNNCLKALEVHLSAISARDLPKLESTLSPTGNMELILPGREITFTTTEFWEMHKAWFKDTLWTFEPNVLSSNVGDKLGIATVEIMYKEPERNGKPYFNKMAVSYVLEKMEGKWYVIKDQSCSLERTPD